jgi:hypothetical protein
MTSCHVLAAKETSRISLWSAANRMWLAQSVCALQFFKTPKGLCGQTVLSSIISYGLLPFSVSSSDLYDAMNDSGYLTFCLYKNLPYCYLSWGVKSSIASDSCSVQGWCTDNYPWNSAIIKLKLLIYPSLEKVTRANTSINIFNTL